MTTTGRTGYTLLEVLVTLVLLSLAGALAVPAFATLRPASPADAAAAQLLAVLRTTRDVALASGRDATVTFDAKSGRVWAHPRDTSYVLDLPGECQLVGPARTTLRFAPDGRAHGRAPSIGCAEAHIGIALDPLTGRAVVRWGP